MLRSNSRLLLPINLRLDYKYIFMTQKTFSITLFLMLFLAINNMSYSQIVPVTNYSINSTGQVQLEVNSTINNYYLLKIRHDSNSVFELSTSMTLGSFNTTTITEPLEHYPLNYYQVLEYPISSPVDTDGDGIDDITEYQNMPLYSPVNAATTININNGLVMVDNFSTFKSLSIKKNLVQWSEFLNGKEFVKYIIVDFDSVPKIYFINSDTHNNHSDFATTIGIDHIGNHVKKGQIIYHPSSISNNGTLGNFAFNYSNGHPQDFDVVQKTHELLAANMPFLENNLSYFITTNNEAEYYQDSTLFQNSRIPVLFESDIYDGLDYWGLNQTEGFGFFRQVPLEETPSAKDIVLYESLPNALPRVGGIMTSVIQTPLSHVNLRAIQNKIPNAFIRDPLSIDSISNLLNDYIYFKVERDNFFIRKATAEEVNNWFENIRPTTEQFPPLNLSYTTIFPLDSIVFTMYDGFGAKSANLATLKTFNFPDKTIPDGFGVPFYFYQEFMNYNNFFEEIDSIINNPEFKSDRDIRDDLLKRLRKKIKKAEMPDWMMNQLAIMHESFPEGTSLRCRSSSNNEDLAGFNGAGLYTSKTQHPDEGHISKSIKQVYASLWNLRAFEERDFYRINHFVTSMGVLCHPNYSSEKSNSVAVSSDPIYNSENTFYLNSQIGEDLITNPDTNSIPEEILLDKESGYVVIEHSNFLPNDTTIMSEEHLNQLRDYLSVIHNEFEKLYNAKDNQSFSMDIECKITSDNQLIIKQARPWVSYIPTKKYIFDYRELKIFPNPAQDFITIQCNNCNLIKMKITNIVGQQFQENSIDNTDNSNTTISVQSLPAGIYLLTGFGRNNKLYDSKKFIKK